MIINCPNCGAPLTHLTSGDVCEYCGTSFPFPECLTVAHQNFYMHEASAYMPFYSPSIPAQINIYADGELVDSRYVDPFENAISMIQDYDAYGRRR